MGQKEPLHTSERTNAKQCLWEGRAPGYEGSWGLAVREAPLPKKDLREAI